MNDDSDNEEGQDIKIKSHTIHEKYSSKSKLNDIALLKLEKPAVLAHNVFPACVSSKIQELGTEIDSEKEIKKLTIIGFGRVENDNCELLIALEIFNLNLSF